MARLIVWRSVWEWQKTLGAPKSGLIVGFMTENVLPDMMAAELRAVNTDMSSALRKAEDLAVDPKSGGDCSGVE